MNGKYIVVVSLVLLRAPILNAATLTVTSTADNGPGTLRAALAVAADGDAIDFSVTGTILLTSGELLVNKSVAILGPGPRSLALDGNTVCRVFHVGSNVVANISGLTITNGNPGSALIGGGVYNDHSTLTLSNCAVSGNSARYYGGGIYNDGYLSGSAALSLNACIVSGNSAYSGGGIFNNGDLNGSASVAVSASTIVSNSANLSGGAIYNDGENGGSATLSLTTSAIISNSASGGAGGGIFNYGYSGSATGSVNACTFSGNTAAGGGGIYNREGALKISASTLSSNSATQEFGGGIFNDNAMLWANNCTLSDNSANLGGGGICNLNTLSGISTASVIASTFSGNSAKFLGSGSIFNYADPRGSGGTVEIGNTILNAGASSSLGNSSGTVTSLGYNLSSDSGGGLLTGAGDQVNTDPMLGPLQDNGGPTFTHALLPGSPAIDKGKNFGLADTDQRGAGFARTVDDPTASNAQGGDGTDIGAFEVQVRSPADQLADLIAWVKGLGLPAGTVNSLTVKLQVAVSALAHGNAQAACGNLSAFVNEVNAQKDKKLSVAQAVRLIAEAGRIRAELHCQ